MQQHLAKKWFFVTCLIFLLIYLALHLYIKSMDTIKGWPKSSSRDTAYYINPTNSTILLKPKYVCPLQTYLLIIVCSSPSNFHQRLAVRETWGFFKNRTDVKLYFLLGQTNDVNDVINLENDIYQDIIVENFVDTYNNLTIKSLLLLKLVKLECKDTVKFVMKVDDDTFINVDNLLKALKNVKRKSTLLGSLSFRSRPVRESYEKWFVPKYMYAKEVYPNYLSGVAYVMTADVAVKLFDTALRVPLLYLEDVYITGLCAQAAGIVPEMNKEFYTNKVKFNPCKYKNLIVSHYNSPMEMRSLHYCVHNENLDKACKAFKIKGNHTKPKSTTQLTTVNVKHAFC